MSRAGRFGWVQRKVCVETQNQLKYPKVGKFGARKLREGCWEAAAGGQHCHLAAAPPPPEQDGFLQSFWGGFSPAVGFL